MAKRNQTIYTSVVYFGDKSQFYRECMYENWFYLYAKCVSLLEQQMCIHNVKAKAAKYITF